MAITGAQIASVAQKYIGAGYSFGGDCSAGPGDWDCSSFVSWCLGHDLGLPLPGGSWGAPGFPPNSHGPTVLTYYQWAGVSQVGTASPGVLCLWPGEGADGHVGVAVSSTEMVSALNSQDGTQQTAIVGTGPAGVPLVYMKLNVAALSASAAGVPLTGATGSAARSPLIALLTAAGLLAMPFAVVAVAGLAATIAVALAVAGAKRAAGQ